MSGLVQMHSIARTDQARTLKQGGSDTQFGEIFSLDDLDPLRPALIMFKVSGTSGAQLVMTNDGTENDTVGGPLISFTLDGSFTKPRTWHEIVAGGSFSDQGKNKFSVQIHAGSVAGSKVIFSDVVLLYHMK